LRRHWPPATNLIKQKNKPLADSHRDKLVFAIFQSLGLTVPRLDVNLSAPDFMSTKMNQLFRPLFELGMLNGLVGNINHVSHDGVHSQIGVSRALFLGRFGQLAHDASISRTRQQE
jgi:hypothetical protein